MTISILTSEILVHENLTIAPSLLRSLLPRICIPTDHTLLDLHVVDNRGRVAELLQLSCAQVFAWIVKGW